jgi:hypothetical protein
MKKKCQEARRTPGKMKDARRGKMTPARAQRIIKKTEERSPLPLFSPARKMESDAGHEKRKLMLEGLRLGQAHPSKKFGQNSEKFRENLAKFEGSEKQLIEGASPPSKNNQVSLNPVYNQLVISVRKQSVRRDTIGRCQEKWSTSGITDQPGCLYQGTRVGLGHTAPGSWTAAASEGTSSMSTSK